jgi:hypothetical protein
VSNIFGNTFQFSPPNIVAAYAIEAIVIEECPLHVLYENNKVEPKPPSADLFFNK